MCIDSKIKEEYTKPDLEIIEFQLEESITTSAAGSGSDLVCIEQLF